MQNYYLSLWNRPTDQQTSVDIQAHLGPRCKHGASSPKQAYLLFCFNFFFLPAHGLTAVAALLSADEGDIAKTEPFCCPNIFRAAELCLAAAAAAACRVSPSQPPSCAGIPGELEETQTQLKFTNFTFRPFCTAKRRSFQVPLGKVPPGLTKEAGGKGDGSGVLHHNGGQIQYWQFGTRCQLFRH